MEWMILPLKRYFDFSGRSRRKEFWMYTLFVVIATIVLSILDSMLGLGGDMSGESDFTGTSGGVSAGVSDGWLANIFALATFIPSLAVSVRRLHDLDRTGWWVALPVLPALLGGVLVGVGAAQAISGDGDGSVAMYGMVLAGVAVLTALLLLVWYCMSGTAGPNRFGEDPKGQGTDADEVFG